MLKNFERQITIKIKVNYKMSEILGSMDIAIS